MKVTAKKYISVETPVINNEITNLLKNKIVEKITKVTCDEGMTIHFTDGTKLEFSYDGCYGITAINNNEINCSGGV